MNFEAIKSIYFFEMARTRRTLLQSVISPVISTSLYFIVFGAAVGSRIQEVEGVSYGAFITPGLIMLTLLGQCISNGSFGIYFPKFTGTIYEVLSAPVMRVLTPRSIPMTVPGRACRTGMSRSSATVNETCQRCAVRDTVADKIRAVPAATRRASFVVGSCVAMVPSRGRVTVLPWQRMVPVSRKESLALRRFLYRGKPGFLPFRCPFLDLTKSARARSRFRKDSW